MHEHSYSAALANVSLVMLSFSDYAKANRWSEMVVVVWQEYQADGDIRVRLGSVTAVVSVQWLLALRGQKRHIFSKETVTISPNKCEIHLFPQGVFNYINTFRFFTPRKKEQPRAASMCICLHVSVCVRVIAHIISCINVCVPCSRGLD